MPSTGFTRPTFTQIRDRVMGDINSRLTGADSRVRRSTLTCTAFSLSGLAHGLYGALDWIARQVFPDLAEAENAERWANLWSINRIAAVKATGAVTLTGTNGMTIADGTRMRRRDGFEYVITEAVTISAGSATADIQAAEAGEDGNADADTILDFINPIAGVDDTGTTGAVTLGADAETDESLLDRLLDRLRNPPHGGSENDYIQWAQEASADVTRAWCFPLELGASSVVVRFMTDDATANGIPSGANVTLVQNYIDTVRPVTAEVFVEAPVAVPLNFTIRLKNAAGATESSATIRAAVEAELEDLIRRDAEPGGTILFSRIREAISTAAGEFDHSITVPAADITHDDDEIATMGTITWSA